jgi:hypothetical protein
MQKFEAENIEEELKLFLRDWVKLLSEGRFEEAVQQLDISLDGSDVYWNPVFLRDVINEYAELYKNAKLTNPYLMELSKERIDVYPYNDNSGFAVDYNLPVNGEWSDLTAQFSFKKNKSLFAVYLEDVHVL